MPKPGTRRHPSFRRRDRRRSGILWVLSNNILWGNTVGNQVDDIANVKGIFADNDIEHP